MKLIPQLTGLLVLALAGATAQASTFNFSYTFGDGLNVTGSLDGNQNGLFVNNVTNISVYFNGDAMPGPIFASQYDAVNSIYVTGPIVSFDALQNNFFFSSSDLAAGDFAFDSIFYMVNASVYPSDNASAVSYTLNYGSVDDPTVASAWSLSLAPGSSVPDQGTTLGLFALGLAGLGGLHRRFRSVGALVRAR